MRRRRSAIIAAALVTLFSCGGDSGGDDPGEGRGDRDSAEQRQSSTAERDADGSSFTVEVTVDGSYPRRAVHFVRVERPDGSQVFERALGPTNRTSAELAPGRYRVLSYQRQCRTSCATDPSPGELGEPVDVCGSYFDVAGARTTRAVVKIVPDEGCEISLP